MVLKEDCFHGSIKVFSCKYIGRAKVSFLSFLVCFCVLFVGCSSYILLAEKTVKNALTAWC